MISARQWATRTIHGDAKTLASIRMSLGLSQKQLAEACGMEQPHISRYEAGRSEPSIIVAKKVASILNISIDEFTAAFMVARSRIKNESNN